MRRTRLLVLAVLGPVMLVAAACVQQGPGSTPSVAAPSAPAVSAAPASAPAASAPAASMAPAASPGSSGYSKGNY